MTSKPRKILVTGADGFIGSHLVEYLVRKGYAVKAFVFYNSFGQLGWLDRCAADVAGKFEIFAGDIRDPYGVQKAMKGCDAVLHLASLIAIPYSYHSPETYVDTNIKGTLNVLQAAKALGVEKIVHTSTSEVYGTARYVPINEEHPLQGQSPYSATKIGADQLALSFWASFDTPISVVRPFNTYGPRQSARAVIPSITLQLLTGASTIQLGSVTPTRDFSFVEDTVKGFVAVMNAPACIGKVTNIGSGFEISIMDTAKAIAELMGVNLTIETDSQRLRPQNSEVERLFADYSKAAERAGWVPEYAGREGFLRGLSKTIDWFRDPANTTGYKGAYYNI